MKKYILITITLLIAISIIAVELGNAPDFQLENQKGERVKLSDFNDKLVLLDFWATWCVPCCKELPHLSKLQEKYGDHIQVLAITIDKARQVSKAKAFVKSNRFKFMTLFDPKQEVANLYNMVNPPRTLLIDPSGKIIFQHDGYKRGDEVHLEEEIVKWIESQQMQKSQEDIMPVKNGENQKKPEMKMNDVDQIKGESK